MDLGLQDLGHAIERHCSSWIVVIFCINIMILHKKYMPYASGAIKMIGNNYAYYAFKDCFFEEYLNPYFIYRRYSIHWRTVLWSNYRAVHPAQRIK